MIKTMFLALVTIAVVLATYLFFYLGLYKTASVTRESRGPLHLLYKTHSGAFYRIGPVLHEVELWAGAHGVKCDKTFGEFLDDPESVDEDRLRSRAGCIVEGKPSQPLGDIEYEEHPAGDYVVGRFSGSPSVGPLKVYPKIKHFIIDQRLRTSLPNLEIYTVRGDAVDTEYLFRLDPSQP
jgi:AraC family transcriptional regulator